MYTDRQTNTHTSPILYSVELKDSLASLAHPMNPVHITSKSNSMSKNHSLFTRAITTGHVGVGNGDIVRKVFF